MSSWGLKKSEPGCKTEVFISIQIQGSCDHRKSSIMQFSVDRKFLFQNLMLLVLFTFRTWAFFTRVMCVWDFFCSDTLQQIYWVSLWQRVTEQNCEMFFIWYIFLSVISVLLFIYFFLFFFFHLSCLIISLSPENGWILLGLCVRYCVRGRRKMLEHKQFKQIVDWNWKFCFVEEEFH